MGAVPLQVIEPQPLFLVHPGGGHLAATEQAGPQGMVGLQQEVWVLDALGQAEELLPQRPHRLSVAACVVHQPEAPQHAEELRRLPHLLTQLAGPGVQPFHLWCPLALGCPERRTEGHLHDQFLLAALAGLWQGGEEV